MSLKNVKVAAPKYNETVPSSGKKVKITPFKVADEKALLIASESKDPSQMVNALKQIVGNCVEGADVNTLAPYDLEYLFLRLRAVSVGETSDIKLKCGECEELVEVTVDFQSIKVKKHDDHTDLIKISDDLAFKMKYPDLEDVASATDDFDSILGLVCKSVDTVFYGEETLAVSPTDLDDLKNILEQLSSDQFKEVKKFFDTTPKLSHDIEFKCKSCGHDNKQKLEGLASFF